MSKKSAPKPAKTMTREELIKEYGELCAQAGDLQYKIHAFNVELAHINERMREMNQIAHQLAEAAAKEEAAKTPVESASKGGV